MQFNGNDIEPGDALMFSEGVQAMVGSLPIPGRTMVGVVQSIDTQTETEYTLVIIPDYDLHGSNTAYVSDPALVLAHWKPATTTE